MLSKTHIAIGLAASFTALMPRTAEAAIPVLVGGSIGSIICDIDCRDRSKDAKYGRIIVLILCVIAVLFDANTDESLSRYITSVGKYELAGAGILFFTSATARLSDHRSFSHSLLALALYTAGLLLAAQAILPSFVIAYLTHILLDLTNKKRVRLLFPRKRGFCLSWFFADRTANAVFLILGCVWLTAIVWYCGLLPATIYSFGRR